MDMQKKCSKQSYFTFPTVFTEHKWQRYQPPSAIMRQLQTAQRMHRPQHSLVACTRPHGNIFAISFWLQHLWAEFTPMAPPRTTPDILENCSPPLSTFFLPFNVASQSVSAGIKCRHFRGTSLSHPRSPAFPTLTSMQYQVCTVLLHLQYVTLCHLSVRETCNAGKKLRVQSLQVGLTVASFMSIISMNAKHVCIVLPGYTCEYLEILHSEQLAVVRTTLMPLPIGTSLHQC